MRIRKHANISSQLLSSSNQSLLQPHFCQLNQSPWDVITFPPSDSSSSYIPPPPPFQFDGNDSFTRNEIVPDSIGAVKSVESERESMEVEEKKTEEEIGEILRCMRTTHEENSLGKNRSTKIRKHNNSPPPPVSALAQAAKNCPRSRGKKPAQAKISHEYYYYTGFGPRWGKKRGTERKATTSNEASKCVDGGENVNEERVQTYPTQNEILDFVKYKDDDNNGRIIKKRARKPIKARSLKSLM